MNFNTRISEFQQRQESTQERLDLKNQKYKELKVEMQRLKEEGLDKDSGFARLKEEVELSTKAKLEAEQKLKKFEAKFRQAVQEIEELREQLEVQKAKVTDDISDSMSFIGAGVGNSQVRQLEQRI